VLKEMRPGNKPPLDNPYGIVVNLPSLVNDTAPNGNGKVLGAGAVAE
jgi:hypothetical protein